ncbi:MAG TPA: hypothetical protein VF575_03380 [Candidatus Saccharimonadales bacterium]|jgi:hypothetical protein
MVDTIKLLLKIDDPMVLSKGAFTPLSVKQLMRAGGMTRTFLNPSSKYASHLGKYMPRLTLHRRAAKTIGVVYQLAVEFSAPKLLYGNNFSEVEEEDFIMILMVLRDRIHELTSYKFTLSELAAADVGSWHPCKNVIFRGYISAQTILGTVPKLDVSRLYDVQRTNFRDGHVVHIHCNSVDVAFYDKLADLRKAAVSDKRAFEDDSAIQLRHLASLEKSGVTILRQEVRLGGRQAIKRAFSDLDSWTFESLYKAELCQATLLKHWHRLSNSVDMLSLDAARPYELLQNYMLDSPDASAKDALAAIGSLLVCGQEGVLGLRNLIEPQYGSNVWYRIKKLVRNPSAHRFTHFQHVQNTLETFKPLRMSDIKLFEDDSK